MTTRIGVIGAAGRMGASVCQAVHADSALQLVAAVDPQHVGLDLDDVTGVVGSGLSILASATDAFQLGVDVVVDFTVADASRHVLLQAAEAGVHAVVGTTGFDDADLAAFGRAFVSSNCLIAPNFAISAVLMMRFAELAAPFFDTGEIVELHHDNKVDAPSGTAVTTAERMAAVSDEWADDPTEHEVYPGARGGVGPGGIRLHAVRMRGMVAHQEVILGAQGQSLTIRQDSYDRSSFMPGVILACKLIGDHPGLTLGLDPFLDI